MSDTVTLSVPARPEYAKTVRMTAAALATRAGMPYEAVEDVRLAAEEAFAYACGRTEAGVAVTLEFTVSDGGLDVAVGPVPAVAAPAEEAREVAEYARFILDAVCDDLDISDEGGACHVRLSKRIAPGAPGA
ncbi:MAG: ATP-binding protein [Actinobacteria bacterium]|nr:MAG: ATP-binding protein [Actinomycetota bacterium]